MQSLGVHHVSINVDNVEESVAFYCDVLGATQRNDRPDLGFPGAWLDVGHQQLHLINADVPANLGQHFAISVADLDGAVAELRSKRVAVPEPTPIGAARQTFLQDPSGNVVELHEPSS